MDLEALTAAEPRALPSENIPLNRSRECAAAALAMPARFLLNPVELSGTDVREPLPRLA